MWQAIFVSSPLSSKPCKTNPDLDSKVPSSAGDYVKPKKLEGMMKQHVLRFEGTNVIIFLPLKSSKEKKKCQREIKVSALLLITARLENSASAQE